MQYPHQRCRQRDGFERTRKRRRRAAPRWRKLPQGQYQWCDDQRARRIARPINDQAVPKHGLPGNRHVQRAPRDADQWTDHARCYRQRQYLLHCVHVKRQSTGDTHRMRS